MILRSLLIVATPYGKWSREQTFANAYLWNSSNLETNKALLVMLAMQSIVTLWALSYHDLSKWNSAASCWKGTRFWPQSRYSPSKRLLKGSYMNPSLPSFFSVHALVPRRVSGICHTYARAARRSPPIRPHPHNTACVSHLTSKRDRYASKRDLYVYQQENYKHVKETPQRHDSTQTTIQPPFVSALAGGTDRHA